MCTAISLQRLRNLAEGQLTLAIGEPHQCEDDLNGNEDGDDVGDGGDYLTLAIGEPHQWEDDVVDDDNDDNDDNINDGGDVDD